MGVCLHLAVILSLASFLSGEKPENSRLNFFDIDLFHYAAEEKRGNVAVSPASLKSTLAMILEGARGATAAEIRSALRLSPVTEEYREQLNSYLSVLQSSNPALVLENSNAIFVSSKLILNKEYATMLRKIYMTEVRRTNFADPVAAAASINDWISNSTKGLIPTIVESAHLTPSTELLLTNALYFKARWKRSFDPRSTRAGCFYLQGACRSVAMMELHTELNYAYVANLRAHAVELPYEGDQYSMILVVPQERDGLAALIRDLPYMSLSQIAGLFEPNDVTISLPRFTVDYGDDMVATLKNMRISSLFSATANLSGIFDGEAVEINNMFHKVHLSVDETGTVAAAASAGMVIPLIQDGVQIRVDRPFIFFVKDNRLGLVLFEGKIEEPTAYVDMNGLIGQNAKKAGGGSPKRFPLF